ncbi:MAG: cupin domain-containing protein, partial [Proteobacteria bacterium]|nr:cupin domain-containing protein [Pseudomonadota bacterium]
PMYIYRWDNTRATLDRLRDHAGSPFDGILVEYTDPVNGGPVVPTMSFRAQLLRAGETTRTHRHTTNTVYCALEGEGVSEVGGMELEWHRNDVFIVPGWTWHSHINRGTADAVLYSVSDAPVHEKLGVYLEQEKSPTGEISQVVPWPQTKPDHPALG